MFARENCWREAYRSGDQIKVNCGGCPACLAQKHSREVALKHVPTKFCVESNVCAYCCRLKCLFRRLKHVLFAGRECGRKCEVCLGPERDRVTYAGQTRQLIRQTYEIYLASNVHKSSQYMYRSRHQVINIGLNWRDFV